MNILIKFPSRGRRIQFFKTYYKYVSNASDISKIHFLITVDNNDPDMKDLGLNNEYTTVVYGDSGSKIAAVNRDLQNYDGYDIILLASDDMIPVKFGYDQIIRDKMEQYYPDTDGCLWFNDGTVGDRLNTLSILGKKYYDRFGYIYHPSYKSLFCDNEHTDVARKLQKITYFPQVIIKHMHPSNVHGIKYDALYKLNDTHYKSDMAIYNKRKMINFDL